MTNKFILTTLFTVNCIFIVGQPCVWGQSNQVSRSDEIIISASKIEESITQTGSSVIVITQEEIEKKQYKTVLEAIKGKTGIGSSASGHFGGTSDVYLRGANAAHTLVMIDGARIYDAITADADYNLAHLTLDNVERIEIIKGPQSSLYGSDAMGGVINIITKKGKGEPSFTATAEAGTYDTYTKTIEGHGSIDKAHYSFSASRQQSTGISKARDGSESDAYQRSSVNSKMSYQFSDDLEIGVQGLYLYARHELDDGAFQDDPNRLFKEENSLARIFADHNANDWWNQKLKYSWYRNIRWDSDDSDAVDTTEFNRSIFKGWLQEVDWQHNINAGDLLSLGDRIDDNIILGFQFNHESGRSISSLGSNTPINRANTLAYYFQNKISLDEKLFWTLAFRTDDHSRFGFHTTGRTTLSYLFPTHTRLKGSYGTGFNAPSIFQLFSDFGDPDLSAGTSWGYDIGLEQDLLDQKVTVSSVFFLNRFKDLIEFDSSEPNPKRANPGRYVNRGSARTSGIESEIRYSPIKNLTLKYGFTYLEARDLENNVHLRRRPNLQHNININLALWERLNWNVDVIRNLKTYDSTRLKDYTYVDMAFNYAFNNDIDLYAKVENIFDETFQEVSGFSNLPRHVSGGVKVRF